MVYDRREHLNKAFQPGDDDNEEPDVGSLQSLAKTTTTTTSQSGQRGHAGQDGRSAAEAVRPLGAGRDKRKAGASASSDAKAERPVASASSEPSSSASSLASTSAMPKSRTPATSASMTTSSQGKRRSVGASGANASAYKAKTKLANGIVHRDTAPAVSSKQGNKHNKPTSASALKVREINSDSSQDEIQLSSSGVKVQARSSGSKRKRSRKRAKESSGRAPPNGSAESSQVRDGTRSQSHSPLPTPPGRQSAAPAAQAPGTGVRESKRAAVASTPGDYMFSSNSSAGDFSSSIERAVVSQKQHAPPQKPVSQPQPQPQLQLQPPKPSTPSKTILSVEIPNTARASVKRKPSGSNDGGRYGGSAAPSANGPADTPKKRRIEATSERPGSSVASNSRTASSLASSIVRPDGAEGKRAGTKSSNREPRSFVYQVDLTTSEADRTLTAPPKPTSKSAPASSSSVQASITASYSTGPQRTAPCPSQPQPEVVINKMATRLAASTPSKAFPPVEEQVAATARKPVPALLPASRATSRVAKPPASAQEVGQLPKPPSPSRSASSVSPRAAKTAIVLGREEYTKRKGSVAANGRPVKAIPPSSTAIAAEAIAYSAIQKQSRTSPESHSQSKSQAQTHSQKRTLTHKRPSPRKGGKRPVKGDLPAPPPRRSGQILECDDSDRASDASDVEVLSDRDNATQRKTAQTVASSSQSGPGPSSSQSRLGQIGRAVVSSLTKPSKAMASSRSSAKSKQLAFVPIGSSQGSAAGRMTMGQATPKADAHGPARPEHLSPTTDSDTPIVASGSARQNGSNLHSRSRAALDQPSSRKRRRDSDEFHEDDEISSGSSRTKPRARPSTNKIGLAALRAKEAAASTPRKSPRSRPTSARQPASAKGKAVRVASTTETGTEEDGGAEGDEDDSDNAKEIFGQATQEMWFENVLNGRDAEIGELHSDASQSTLASQSQEAAQESEEEDAFGEKIAKGPLCPFCDGPLPARPTPRLLEMLKKLCLRSDLELRGGSHNPHALNLPSMVTAATCKRHRDEREVIPTGLQRGYPPPDGDVIAKIEERFERVCYDALAEVVRGKRESPFLDSARLEWETKGARKMGNVLNEWSSFDQELPGYYGPQGFEAIINSINTYMIQRDPLILAHRTAPLDVATYLRRVMVPEAAIALIIDDYSGAPDGPIDRSRATEVLRESRAYGAAVFALDGTFGRDGLNKAAETAAEKKQRHREEDEAEKEREAVLASGDRRRIRAVERGPKAFAQIKKALKAAERSAKRS